MGQRALPPEACLDLKISLDKLRQREERCREGLTKLVDGQLTREGYITLVDRQVDAQKAWEERYRKYFTERRR